MLHTCTYAEKQPQGRILSVGIFLWLPTPTEGHLRLSPVFEGSVAPGSRLRTHIYMQGNSAPCISVLSPAGSLEANPECGRCGAIFTLWC